MLEGHRTAHWSRPARPALAHVLEASTVGLVSLERGQHVASRTVLEEVAEQGLLQGAAGALEVESLALANCWAASSIGFRMVGSEEVPNESRKTTNGERDGRSYGKRCLPEGISSAKCTHSECHCRPAGRQCLVWGIQFARTCVQRRSHCRAQCSTVAHRQPASLSFVAFLNSLGAFCDPKGDL